MYGSVILIFLGGVFGLGSFLFMYWAIRLKLTGLTTEAIVARVDNTDDESRTYFYTFKDINGEVHEIETKSYSFLSCHKLGKSTTIFYDIKDPKRYYHLESESIVGQLFGLIIGVGMFSIGMIMFMS